MSRREEIIDCLVDMYRRDSMRTDFTISELASKVDIGKSTIYEYFKTKDEILTQSILRVINQGIKSIFERNSNDELPFEESLKDEIKYILSIATDSRFIMNVVNPDFKRMIPEENRSEIMGRMQEVSKFYEERFQNIFKKGILEGVIKPEQDQYKSMLISSMVAGSVMRMTNSNDFVTENFDISTYIDKMYETILKVLS